jgi:tRNA (guanine37-N1)-methyltransferase
MICGHYEGIDERVRDLVDYEISIGDFVLTGGEIGAVVLVDTIARLIPGVLKKADASKQESFSEIGGKRILEYPHYTRPPIFKGKSVPKELLSGNFKKIEDFRLDKALKITKKRRPDIIR